jgi:hypothetical protein
VSAARLSVQTSCHKVLEACLPKFVEASAPPVVSPLDVTHLLADQSGTPVQGTPPLGKIHKIVSRDTLLFQTAHQPWLCTTQAQPIILLLNAISDVGWNADVCQAEQGELHLRKHASMPSVKRSHCHKEQPAKTSHLRWKSLDPILN